MTSRVTMSQVDIDQLQPNPWNTNVVSPENEQKLKASFERYGCYKPIIVRELLSGALQILGGEHRWRTAKDLDYKTVPIVNLGRISDKKAKEIGLVDNGRYGEDDSLKLAELLNDMDVGDLMSFLPYAENDFAAVFASTDIGLDDLDIPDDDRAVEMPTAKAVRDSQLMRFKVPIDDAAWITKLIERTMKEQGLTEDDSMTNAGHALVYLLGTER